MGIADYLKPENILFGIEKGSRDDVFRTMVQTLATNGVLEAGNVDLLVKKLVEREMQCTTGVGEGIAIPHASIDSINETVIVLGVVPGGVDFKSVDGAPVDVVFMIIGSQKVPREHIQILAKIVRLCKNKPLMKLLRTGSSKKDLLETIRQLDT